PPMSAPFPYPTLFRSIAIRSERAAGADGHRGADLAAGVLDVTGGIVHVALDVLALGEQLDHLEVVRQAGQHRVLLVEAGQRSRRSEEHTSELQSREKL